MGIYEELQARGLIAQVTEAAFSHLKNKIPVHHNTRNPPIQFYASSIYYSFIPPALNVSGYTPAIFPTIE